MKIPQGKQCRTHVLKVLQVPHPLSTCTEAQWLPVVLPLLYSAARLFALLVPHSFRQLLLADATLRPNSNPIGAEHAEKQNLQI